MNRRTSILAALTVTAAAYGVATTAATAAAAPTPEPDRPNVLLITLDDAARQDFKYLPFTRQLVGETAGVTLDNLVAPTPLCTPSRASLLTGEYAHKPRRDHRRWSGRRRTTGSR